MSLLAHVGLLVALAFGVQWQSQPPPVMVAELWASVPQARAADPNAAPESLPEPQASDAVPAQAISAQQPEVKPPLPEPKVRQPSKPVSPPVADAQIATSKPKEKTKEKPQQEPREERQAKPKPSAQTAQAQDKPAATATAATAAEAARKARLLAQQQAREDARLAQLRDANLKRMLGQAGASSGGTAARAAVASGPSASYAGRIKARIQPLIVFGDNPAANPVATVEVRLAADGTILGRRVARSSGLKAWDEAVLRAIDAAQVLPRDTDGRVPPVMEIEFRLRE